MLRSTTTPHGCDPFTAASKASRCSSWETRANRRGLLNLPLLHLDHEQRGHRQVEGAFRLCSRSAKPGGVSSGVDVVGDNGASFRLQDPNDFFAGALASGTAGDVVDAQVGERDIEGSI